MQHLSEKFLTQRIEPDIINVCRSSCKVPVILVRIELNLNYQDRFLKNTHIKFHENPFIGNRVVPRGQKDGVTDRRNKVFTVSQMC